MKYSIVILHINYLNNNTKYRKYIYTMKKYFNKTKLLDTFNKSFI